MTYFYLAQKIEKATREAISDQDFWTFSYMEPTTRSGEHFEFKEIHVGSITFGIMFIYEVSRPGDQGHRPEWGNCLRAVPARIKYVEIRQGTIREGEKFLDEENGQFFAQAIREALEAEIHCDIVADSIR